MDKIRLGQTGMMVSRLGFGGIPIQRVSEEEAVAIVKRCLDLGITYFDTANAYTTSEERIGKAIKGRRQEVILATKSHLRTREGIEKHLKLSLERLGTDYIDLYQFHQVGDPKALEAILEPDGPMAVLEKAKKAGVVKHIGVTSHQIDTAKDAVKSGRFETLMFPFNFITREPAEELLPLCREHGVGFIAMKPLAGGMLDNASLAFKYLWQFPDVLPIPGIERIPEIEEIVHLLAKPPELTEAEQDEIQRLRDELGTQFCRRCDYCQPCNTGIPISTVMTISSALKRLSLEKVFTGNFANAIEKAKQCIECADCEARCPFHLPIRELLIDGINCFEEAKIKYEEQMKK